MKCEIDWEADMRKYPRLREKILHLKELVEMLESGVFDKERPCDNYKGRCK